MTDLELALAIAGGLLLIARLGRIAQALEAIAAHHANQDVALARELAALDRADTTKAKR